MYRPENRFIPGYAGNALPSDSVTCSRSVYPRLRGERCDRHVLSRIWCGLSPATRGTPPVSEPESPPARFIPGYAGNARADWRTQGLRAVYPRLRGERITCRGLHEWHFGLSPATRGTRHSGGSHAPRFAVYPRLRGERELGFVVRVGPCGLSPATRGTRGDSATASD